jgi:RNA polymerase sigma factor (sigma-70 family)
MVNTLQQQSQAHAHSTFMFKHGTPQADMERAVWTEFRSSNRKALDYLYEKYVRLLYVYGGKISRNHAIVEDCIHDLFVELWNKRKILGETDNIKFYLFKTLRKKIVNKLSLSVSTEAAPHCETDVDFPIEFNIIQDQMICERQTMMKRALASLTENQREAIYLKFYEKLPYQQIASVMDIDLKSAYKVIGKAIDSLRKAAHSIYHI